MDALSCLTLEKMGAALYLHTKLAARALRAADATDYLARKGVFEGMGISPRPDQDREEAPLPSENLGEQVGAGTFSGLVGGQIGQVTAAAAATPLAMRAMKNIEHPSLSPQEVDTARKLLRVPQNVKMKTGPWEGWSGPAYDPRTNTIHSRHPGSYGTVHEMGHASGLLNRKYSKYPMMLMYGLGRTPLAGVIRASNAANRRYRKEKGLKAGMGSQILADMDAATKAGAGIMLAEEGQATARALKVLSQIHGRSGLVGGAKALLPAYGTYLATVLGNHVIAPKVGDALAGQLA